MVGLGWFPAIIIGGVAKVSSHWQPATDVRVSR